MDYEQGQRESEVKPIPGGWCMRAQVARLEPVFISGYCPPTYQSRTRRYSGGTAVHCAASYSLRADKFEHRLFAQLQLLLT